MLKRAYAMLEVRASSDAGDERVFEGIATTPTPDRMGDVIDPLGATFKNPLPLLHQHDSERPIGTVRFKKATKAGIEFTATIPKIAEPGPLKDRVDTAWGEIKNGLVRAVSIGFRVLADGAERLADGLLFTAIEVLELSTVTVPANADATITNIRTFDIGVQAAPGRPVVKATLPGVSGTPEPRTRKGKAMPRTVAEQIDDFTTTRAAKAAKMAEIMGVAAETGETLDAAQVEEYDTLDAEVKAIDAHLVRLRNLEAAQAHTAVPVIRTASADPAAPAVQAGRVEPTVRAVERSAPGIRMARVTKTLVLAKMAQVDPVALALRNYPNDGGVVEVVRAAVAAATTTDPTWAGALVGDAGAIIADFVAFLRPQTILGRFGQGGIPDLRHVPFRTALIGQTSGGQGYWVGEARAKPLTKFDFTRNTLEPLKVATIAALSDEIIRSSAPDAETIVRDGLVAALKERLDKDFVDPAKAAVAGISPASITNGVAGIPSSGNDAEAVRADIKAVYAAYAAGNNALSGGVWIAKANIAASLGMMTNLLGTPEFAGVDRNGGNLAGFPIIASDYAPADTVVLVNAPEIYLGDEGGFNVDMSREATLEMSDAPTAYGGPPPADATGSLVSMFQNNMVAIRAERTINWLKRRPEAVVMLTGVNWGEPTGGATLSAPAGASNRVRSGSGEDRV